MSTPSDRRYLPTHEWHKPEAGIVSIGVTQFAADELTDVTFVKLPAVGDQIAAGGRFGEIESVKATSDLYSGIAGTVMEVHTELAGNPGLVNSDPYNEGWMIRLRPVNAEDLKKLLTVEQYLQKIGH